MRCFVGLGSNLGDRREMLESAAWLLSRNAKKFRVSPLFSSPAMVPEGAPPSWNKPFLNGVAEFEWEASARDLLAFLKICEREIGREDAPRWAPRLIDLDLLLFGNERIEEKDFCVPHAGISNRSFVLDPLKYLSPSLSLPQGGETVLARSRALAGKNPLWMGILNITPDSFSDGGKLGRQEKLEETVSHWEGEGVQIFDLGAESTRPGASGVAPEEEWKRLAPVLTYLKDRYRNKFFRPKISVDTRNAETAARALALGADIINDVSGFSDPGMGKVLAEHPCDYVLMHSLSVPAGGAVLPETADPLRELKAWAAEKIMELQKAGVAPERILFDPGIGFGKTPAHSLEIIRRAEEFHSLPVRLLFGHSRKSFLNHFGERQATDRDPETLGISLRLAEAGVDVLRVHDPVSAKRAFEAFRGTQK